MRRFADTLPTLRDNQPGDTPRQAGFEADAILKALGVASRTESPRRPPAGGGPSQTPSSGAAETRRAVRERSDTTARAGTVPGAGDATGGWNPVPAADRHRRSVQTAIPPIDVEALESKASALEAALAEARAEEAQKTVAAVAEARAETVAAADARLEAERTVWAQDLAATLSNQLDQAFEALHERIATAAADALAPVLEEEMTRRAVERFSARLSALVARESPARAVVVKGPQPLIDALGELRAGKTPPVRLVASDDAELTVRINDTSLRTTIGMWAGTLTTSNGPRNVSK